MSTLTTIFSTPPLMVEKYSGDIKTIQEYAESISYHDNQNSYASDNTFVMNDDVFTDLKIFAEECIREYTLNVFNSDHKFESDCGWPSFDNAIDGAITYVDDFSHNMIRTEIICTKCDGHLGHVFDDGPTETGKRYCVNSISINFDKKNNQKDE